jgi:hypothetical protein
MRLTPVVLLVLTAVTTGQGLRSEAPHIQRLVEQLGSDSFAEREAATKALKEIGEPALEALEEAAKSTDSGAKARAKRPHHFFVLADYLDEQGVQHYLRCCLPAVLAGKPSM